MRKLLLSLSLLLLAGFASAQDAPLTAPVARPAETTLKIGRVDISDAPYVLIQINVIGDDGSVLRYYNVSVPSQAGDDAAHPTASIAGFLNVFLASQPGETGGIARRANFRVLTWLKNEGYLPGTQAVRP